MSEPRKIKIYYEGIETWCYENEIYDPPEPPKEQEKECSDEESQDLQRL